MSDGIQFREDRVLELLADEAIFGLTAEEQAELDALLATMPDFDRGCMERTVATVHLASVAKDIEPMPESLRRQIRFRAQQP